MHTELYSASKIFTDNLFRIPDYQRGYSWTERHLKDFWNDLEQLETGKNHYTGVLTLEEVSPAVYNAWDDDLWIITSKSYVPYYVVDGQQRLTTIIIILQAILEKADQAKLLNYTSIADIRKRFVYESRDGGISKSFIFGYEKDNPSYEYLKTVILQGRSDNHSAAEETIYTHNLAFAKNYFANLIKDLSHEDLERLYSKITQNLLFNIYTISAGIDVFVAFETMNNRGKPLTHLELLKNRLIFLSTKFRVDPDERIRLRKVINESWKTIYHYLGKNKLRPLGDDAFLETHFFLYFGPQMLDAQEGLAPFWRYRRDGGLYQDYLLERVFTVRNMAGLANLPTPAIAGGKSKELTVKEIYEYAHDIKKCVQTFYQVFNPSDSNLSDEEKIALERLCRVGMQSLLVTSCMLRVRDVKLRVAIFTALERLMFLFSMGLYSQVLNRIDLQEIGIRFQKGEYDGKRVRELLETHVEDVLKEIKMPRALNDWAKRQGYYGWRGVKYFLFEYEMHLQSRSKTKRFKLDWDEFSRENYEEDYATVEHIYPQKATLGCWRNAFQGFAVKERNILRNSLGNLLPLSKPKNSSLRNKCFEDKKEDDGNKVGYTFGCYSENEIANLSQWTATEILDRGLRLLDFMEQRWNFRIGGRTEKVRALGLEFLESRRVAR
jgi:hypothetical protein